MPADRAQSEIPTEEYLDKNFSSKVEGFQRSTEADVPTVVSFQHTSQQYLVVAPDGNHIEIPKELFGLLWDFTEGNKPTGSVIIQFRNGGIAGLEALIKKIYR